MNLLKKNKFKIIFFTSTVLFVIGAYSFYTYTFSEPVKARDLKTDFKGQANEFKFLVTENLKSWTNKVVQIKGEITEIDDNGIILNESIYCQFEQKTDLNLNFINKEIQIKGKVEGFDDLLMEIKLNQCTIIQD